ncbi:Tad domain-containing protein [Ruminococcus sp. HUN007]|uniref:Tad domain-containing protein n=1 Tax=Ruminococcus sp. HUN007 TaxID=1514668 RepID=UPI0005D18B9B|nr:Tad domain-containing protein [Ruminococcus sp. HUN007]
MKNSKIDIKKASRASVSILLSFAMLPIYTFGAAVTDAVRISSARTMAAGAADLASDAGLSDFNGVLKDVYGLFAMSSTEQELQTNLSDYFYRTINNTALTEEDAQSRKYISSLADIFSDPSKADFKNLISLNTESFKAEYTEGAVLANPEVMKSQIAEYMKYSGPLKMSSGILNKIGVFKDFNKQNKAITAKIEYDKSLEKINKNCASVWKSASEYNSFITSGTFSGSVNASENEKRVRDIYKKCSIDHVYVQIF